MSVARIINGFQNEMENIPKTRKRLNIRRGESKAENKRKQKRKRKKKKYVEIGFNSFDLHVHAILCKELSMAPNQDISKR